MTTNTLTHAHMLSCMCIMVLVKGCKKKYIIDYKNAWGWCTGMTQRDGMGREVGGGFRIGNTCTPVVDSC